MRACMCTFCYVTVEAQHRAAADDWTTARLYGRISIGLSVAGAVVGCSIIIIVCVVCTMPYYCNNGYYHHWRHYRPPLCQYANSTIVGYLAPDGSCYQYARDDVSWHYCSATYHLHYYYDPNYGVCFF